MTNLPRNGERAEVLRAVAEMTNGKGVPMSAGGIALPKVHQVEATADAIFRVADACCAAIVIGRPVLLEQGPRGRMEAQVPHIGAMLDRMRAEWAEPTPAQAAKLALVEALKAFQQSVYDLAPKVHAAVAAEAVLPEAPSEGEGPEPLQLPESPSESDARPPEGMGGGTDANGSPC
jgi:hypothetical protein